MQSPKNGELLGLEWGNSESNIIFPDQNYGVGYQYSKGGRKDDALLNAKKVENSSNSLLDHA